MGTINTSMQAVQQTQADLTQIDDLPPLGNDMVSWLWGGARGRPSLQNQHWPGTSVRSPHSGSLSSPSGFQNAFAPMSITVPPLAIF